MVQTRLSQSYDKINILVDYCGAEFCLHAFSANALDGDMPLPSNSKGYSPQKEPPVTNALSYEVTTRKDGLDKRKFPCTVIGTETL